MNHLPAARALRIVFFLDIEDFIFCNLKFKKCFIGHSSIVLAVMRRFSSSFCIQATGCRVTGASKVVFEGTLDGSRRVAVLQMKPGAASLDQEASMMLKLSRHPNIVRFWGSCSEGGEEFILPKP